VTCCWGRPGPGCGGTRWTRWPKTPIVISQLGDRASLVGAVQLAAERSELKA
jgi:hypothetical protein